MSKFQNIQSQYLNKNHSWMMAAFVAVFGGIGAYLLVVSHAATLSGCAVYTFKITGSTMTGTNAASNTAVCVNYMQKILNGTYQANISGFASYADSFTAGSPAASRATGLLADDGNYSAQFMNRLEAFQTFFAYSGSNLAVDGTLTSGSPTVLALCGIGNHMPNPDAQHTWEQASPGAASHFGCGTGEATPTVSSRMPTPTATIGATCNTNGSATVNVSFGSPSGPSNATLTITYANAAATTISYSATTATFVPQPPVADASKVDAGTWTAKLAVSATWGGKSSTVAKVSSACKAPASPPPSGGGSGGTGGSGGSGGGSGSAGTITGNPGAGDTSGNTDSLDNSDSSGSIDISNDTTSGGSDTIDTSGGFDNSGNSSTSDSSGSQDTTDNSSGTQAAHKSTGGTVAAIISGIALVAVVAFFIIRRRRQLVGTGSMWSSDTYGAYAAPTETPAQPAEPAHVDPHIPAFPREDPGQTAARVNWWLPDDERAKIAAGQAPTQPAAHTPTDDSPPDIFEEGRKRLDDEEREWRIKR